MKEGRKLLLVKKPKGKYDEIEETNAVVNKKPTDIYDWTAIKVDGNMFPISQFTLYKDYFIVNRKNKGGRKTKRRSKRRKNRRSRKI